MAASDYTAYSASVTFVDDIAGSGGTPLSAANFNGLRADLTTYIQNHINGLKQDGTAGNNHATADILDYNNGVVVLPETTVYANTAAGGSGVGGMYTQSVRNDMFANLFRIILGGTGSLTARVATFNGNSGNDLNSMYTLLHGALTAVGLTAPVLATNLISDYKPAVSVTAGEIIVGAGGGTTDSSGNVTGGIALQHAPLTNAVSASQPTGVQAQYVVISLAPGTFAPVATGGVVAATAGAAAPPVYPVANKPVALVLWRGATSNPTNVIAAGDIIDLRNLGGGGGGAGGSGTDSGVRASALLLNGTNGIYSGALDVTNAATALAINPALLHLPGDAPPANLVRGLVQADTPSAGRLIVGATTATIIASAASPWSVDIGGVRRTAVASVVGTCSLAGNQQVGLYADVTNAGAPQLTFIAAGGSVSTTQLWLCNFWWNGATLVPTPVAGGTAWYKDFSPLFSAQSPQVQMVVVPMVDTGASGTLTGTNAVQIVAAVPTVSFTVPARCRGWIDLNVLLQTVTFGSGIIYLQPVLDNSSFLTAPFSDPMQASGSNLIKNWRVHFPTLAPGPHTLQLGYLGAAAGTTTFATAAGGVNCNLVLWGA